MLKIKRNLCFVSKTSVLREENPLYLELERTICQNRNHLSHASLTFAPPAFGRAPIDFILDNMGNLFVALGTKKTSGFAGAYKSLSAKDQSSSFMSPSDRLKLNMKRSWYSRLIAEWTPQKGDGTV